MPDFTQITSLSEILPIQQVVFWAMTILVIGGGIGVIAARTLFHSALFLIMSLFGVSGYFALLSAGFLAVVQVMIYVGAIAILILFAIMFDRQAAMTGPQQQKEDSTEFNRQWWVSLPIAFIFFFVLFLVVSSVSWPVTEAEPTGDMVAALGEAFLGSYLIPFQIVGVLLSVALIGGVMLARERTEEETN